MDALFDLLDLDHDGVLSRSELHTAARRLKWHWHEAPVFALLDLLTTPKSLPKAHFTDCMQQVVDDPMGPYGKVLLNSHPYSAIFNSIPGTRSRSPSHSGHGGQPGWPAVIPEREIEDPLVTLLDGIAGSGIADKYARLLKSFGTWHVSSADAAVLIIDPQRSFTGGVWMESIGTGADADVKPIVMAFNNCATFLKGYYGRVEIMFSRCPFPPQSYLWDKRLASFIDDKQPYFIKPGNSILFPLTNGYREWVTRCIDSGKRSLVIGGCTLNSCVRVSAIETRKHFDPQNLQIIVDLSLSGARASNFIPGQQYDGFSGVESAVRQMEEAGVRVVRSVRWGSDCSL